MVGDAPRSPLCSLAVAPRTRGLGVGQGEPALGHPGHVGLVLLGVQAGQVAQGEEGFALQVVGSQHIVVKHGQQQTGPLLPALLGGDQAAGAGQASSHPNLPYPTGSHSPTLTQTPQSSRPPPSTAPHPAGCLGDPLGCSDPRSDPRPLPGAAAPRQRPRWVPAPTYKSKASSKRGCSSFFLHCVLRATTSGNSCRGSRVSCTKGSLEPGGVQTSASPLPWPLCPGMNPNRGSGTLGWLQGGQGSLSTAPSPARAPGASLSLPA